MYCWLITSHEFHLRSHPWFADYTLSNTGGWQYFVPLRLSLSLLSPPQFSCPPISVRWLSSLAFTPLISVLAFLPQSLFPQTLFWQGPFFSHFPFFFFFLTSPFNLSFWYCNKYREKCKELHTGIYHIIKNFCSFSFANDSLLENIDISFQIFINVSSQYI